MQYPNRYNLPPAESLRAMSARDLGMLLLPRLANAGRNWFVPGEALQQIADDAAPRNEQLAELLFEGLSYLEHSGLVSETITHSSPVRMLGVTRMGFAALEDSAGVTVYLARVLPAAELLHPTILKEALPEIDRGPDHFGSAIFNAFKAVEISVRDAAQFGNDKIGTVLMNSAFGPNGPLRDPEVENGEADAIRNLFTGALGAFKNPSSHRAIDERDPQQVMRLLSFASLLLELVDRKKQFT